VWHTLYSLVNEHAQLPESKPYDSSTHPSPLSR